jgi:hypothetical protein
MKVPFKPIPVALIFALLIIASAYFLKAIPARVWVNAMIYMAGTYYWFRYFMAPDKRCRNVSTQK